MVYKAFCHVTLPRMFKLSLFPTLVPKTEVTSKYPLYLLFNTLLTEMLHISSHVGSIKTLAQIQNCGMQPQSLLQKCDIQSMM
jgi:hypothetical protein